MKDNKELHNILKHLATSPNQDINRAAKGVLFQLNQSDEENVACKGILGYLFTLNKNYTLTVYFISIFLIDNLSNLSIAELVSSV